MAKKQLSFVNLITFQNTMYNMFLIVFKATLLLTVSVA